MKLITQLVRTAVNVMTLPVAVVKDIYTLGGVATERESYIVEKLRQIKEEAD